MINNIKTNNNISIINEFRSLIDFINYNDVLLEKMFQIIKKFFDYDAAGIFFNSPDKLETKALELHINNSSIDTKEIGNKFFNSLQEIESMQKHKVNVHLESSINKDIILSNELIMPFMFNNKLLGGICIFSNKDMLKNGIETFNLIINEFLSIFKLKYIYTEQVFKSSVDSLTGLYNRTQFDIGMSQEFNRAKRYNTPFSVAMIDIDHFKNINDTRGHQFGDYVLTEISNIIQHAFRKTDIVYRYGGEEIAIIMPETDSEHAKLPLEKLRQKISNHNFKNKNVTVSIGVANYNKEIQTASEILKQADNMLYKAKESGRNRVCL